MSQVGLLKLRGMGDELRAQLLWADIRWRQDMLDAKSERQWHDARRRQDHLLLVSRLLNNAKSRRAVTC